MKTALDDTRWVDTRLGATPEEIDAAERTLGIRFPRLLREWYGKVQGGQAARGPRFDYPHARLGVIPETVAAFLPITQVPGRERSEPSIQTVTAWLAVDDQLPVGVVPIIDSLGGNYVCLDGRTGSPDPPVVYFDHEQEDVIRLADSFDQFVANLRPRG